MTSSSQAAAQPQHFSLLDGLRGVGALVVVFGHSLESVGKAGPFTHVQAGVDLFFLLSGFVIAHAYGPRMQAGMSAGDYAVRRLIRLYPVVPIAVVFGAAVYLVRLAVFGKTELVAPLLGTVSMNLLLLPSPLLHEDAYGIAWPGNAPLWSLTSEAIVNVLFGLWLWRLRAQSLAVVAVLGAIGFAWSAFRIGSTNIGPGWSELDALVLRPVYPFCAGILLYRFARDHRPRVQVHPSVILLGMIAVLYLPTTGEHDLWVGLLLVWFVMPAVLYSAAFLSSSRSHVLKVLGDMSYPVYALHFPLIKIVNFAAKRHGLHDTMPWTLVIVETLLSTALGYAALRLYDEPVRRWLSRLARERRGLERSRAGSAGAPLVKRS